MTCVVLQKAYLRSPWNQLDFVVVAASVVYLSGVSAQLSVVRALRALRPLRAVERFPRLKLMVYALAHAVPQIVNVVVLCALFFVLFGNQFVNLFKGSLYSCTGPVFEAMTPEQVRRLQ